MITTNIVQRFAAWVLRHQIRELESYTIALEHYTIALEHDRDSLYTLLFDALSRNGKNEQGESSAMLPLWTPNWGKRTDGEITYIARSGRVVTIPSESKPDNSNGKNSKSDKSADNGKSKPDSASTKTDKSANTENLESVVASVWQLVGIDGDCPSYYADMIAKWESGKGKNTIEEYVKRINNSIASKQSA